MKKILYIGCLILSTISCKAQIIPIEEHKSYLEINEEIPDGAYIKDVNHLLDKYVGTWKGTYNSKDYEFRVVPFADSYLNITEDKLFMRYKITDTNGVIIEDTTTLPDSSYYVIKGDYLAQTGSYVLSYIGLESNCGQNGDVFISVYGTNNTQMQLFLQVYGEVYECTTGYAEQILPVEKIELIKQ